MQYHKIHNIDKKVCTKEQEAAYYLAWRCELTYGDYWKKRAAELTGVQRAELINDLLDYARRIYDGAKDKAKYDIDATFAALRAGLEKYMNSPFIAGVYFVDYEKIGAAFPAHYLK